MFIADSDRECGSGSGGKSIAGFRKAGVAAGPPAASISKEEGTMNEQEQQEPGPPVAFMEFLRSIAPEGITDAEIEHSLVGVFADVALQSPDFVEKCLIANEPVDDAGLLIP